VTVSRSVVPGEWYAVLGDDVVVLLPPAAKGRVAGVWECVDGGAGFDEVLDALVSGGLRELPGFLLVSDTAGDVKLVIRGAGEARLVTAEGPVTVSGDADSTWVERHVAGVTGLRLRVAEGDGPSYVLGSGLVRVSSVEQPAPEPEQDTGPLTGASAPEPVPQVADPLTDEIPAQLMEPPRPVADPGASGAAPPVLPPPVEPPPATWTGAHAAAPPPAESLPEEPPTEEPPTEELAEDPAADEPVARLVFSSGQVVDVDRALVVGRAPQPRGDGNDVRLVTVPSPHQEISSTHVEIRPGTGADHGSAVVTDLGSTNGTLLVQPGLPPEDLRPGVAVQLLPGAVVDLGEGVTIQVTTQ
jgi:hypothetical protein